MVIGTLDLIGKKGRPARFGKSDGGKGAIKSPGDTVGNGIWVRGAFGRAVFRDEWFWWKVLEIS